MNILRVIFGIFTLISVWLFFFSVSVMLSDSFNALYIVIIGCVAICGFIFGISAARPSEFLSYLSIGLIAVIAAIWAFVPIGISMSYNPDGNYTGLIVALYAPIIIIASGLLFFVHQHFKNDKIK